MEVWAVVADEVVVAAKGVALAAVAVVDWEEAAVAVEVDEELAMQEAICGPPCSPSQARIRSSLGCSST